MAEPGARRGSGACGLAARLAMLAATLVFAAGCAEIKSRLPSRGEPRSRPPASAPGKPRPPASTSPSKPASATPASTAFPVLPAATAERDKGRLRDALARTDPEALAPDDVGYYLDVLQGRLRQVMGTRAAVARRGNRIAVDLSRGVRFVPGGDGLGPGTREAMDPLGKLLAGYRQVQVSVRVSPVDAAADNDPALAERRALALAQRLAEAGVGKPRLVVVRAGAGGARVEVQLDPVVRPRKAAAPKGR